MLTDLERRFPHRDQTNGKGKRGRGIGSHTDYGLLVIAAQDEVGGKRCISSAYSSFPLLTVSGLFVRPPHRDEYHANWESSAAGHKEDESGWVYVPPVSGVSTVFPGMRIDAQSNSLMLYILIFSFWGLGDMMQYMTDNFLQSTPHKVGLNTRERFAFAYFHEPNFRSIVRPLPGFNAGQSPTEGIHYGTHFTNMCLRNYPDRTTTKNMLATGNYKELLNSAELRAE